MAYSLIVHAKTTSGGGTDSSTSDAIDTTGANLIVVAVSWHYVTTANITLSDNKSNTWTGLTAKGAGDLIEKVRIFYCFNPTVGSGHTFTSTGTSTYATVFVQAWSGSVSSPFDQENGTFSVGTTTSMTTGSVTPSENNELLVTAISTIGSSHAINSSFTVSDNVDVGGPTRGGAMAYKVQTTAGAENPTWSWSGASEVAAAIATFKAASAGGPVIPVFMNQYRQRRN